MFKIIQEFNKKNRAVLTIIPSGFENNGVFWFPPSHWSTRKLNSVLRNPFAKPDVCKWEARPCIVKRSNIKTYALAEEQEEELLNKQITEQEEDADAESEASYSETTKRLTKSTRSPQADFNSVLEDCLHSLSTSNQEETRYNEDEKLQNVTVQNTESSSPVVMYNNPEIILENNGNNKTPADFVLFSDIGNGSVNGSSESHSQPLLQDYEGAISVILGNQQQIFQEISNLREVVTSGIAKLLSQGECLGNLKSMQLTEESKQRNIEAGENFHKILSGEQANQFEDQLEDLNFKGELIRKMSFYIGKNGKRIGQGWTCCYELIDLIFDRSFLKLCSWTGASTSNMEEGKIPFFKLKNILVLFATVITEADPDFSLEKTKEFFKKILRNATRFHSQEISQTRKSTKRERAKKVILEDTANQNKQGSQNIQDSGLSDTRQEGSKET